MIHDAIFPKLEWLFLDFSNRRIKGAHFPHVQCQNLKELTYPVQVRCGSHESTTFALDLVKDLHPGGNLLSKLSGPYLFHATASLRCLGNGGELTQRERGENKVHDTD